MTNWLKERRWRLRRSLGAKSVYVKDFHDSEKSLKRDQLCLLENNKWKNTSCTEINTDSDRELLLIDSKAEFQSKTTFYNTLATLAFNHLLANITFDYIT